MNVSKDIWNEISNILEKYKISYTAYYVDRDVQKAMEYKEEFIHRYLSGIDKMSVIYVPYNDSKSDYIDKNAFTILLDDGIKNIKECEKKCNVCILFDENDKYEYQNRIRKVSDAIDFL